MKMRDWFSFRLGARRRRWLDSIFAGAGLAAGLLLLLALRMEWIDILPDGSAEDGRTAEKALATPPEPTRVRLPAEKRAKAGLHLGDVEVRSIQPTRTVPGTIAYDAARRLSLNSPSAGVILKVLVDSGQDVSARQPLALISSPDVGQSRDEVLRRQADLELAQKQFAFEDEISTNVAHLLTLLERRPQPEELEKALVGKSLGDYRQKIVAPYSKLVLADLRLSGTDDLQEAGALSRRTREGRQSDREVAAAEFAAACEASQFSAVRERDMAHAAVQQAERLLAVAEQSLANLLGPFADRGAVVDREKLSELLLLAPFAGRVEERPAVDGARIALGDPLFVVADTSVMWVAAEIHERDWQVLDAARGGEITVRLPALRDAERKAKVKFVGAVISPETRSAPMIAEVDNADGKLRPGMFVWASAPLTAPRQSLVAPAGAVMRHENRAFVFVPITKDEFRRVDVRTGIEAPAGIEILAGLRAGQQVVDRGAFFLKSEMLLEREE